MNIEILLEDFCHYSTYMRNVKPNTTQRYRSQITYFSETMQVHQITDVSQSKIQKFFIYGRSQKNWKVATYRTYYMTFRVFFRWCIKQGYLDTNFTDDLELPKLEKTLPKRLKKKDALKILEIVYNYPYIQKYQKHRNHAIFSMFLLAGLRKSELLHLKYSDVDIENLTIFIRQGKGNKDRIIPMSYTLAQSLKRYLIDRKRNRKTCPEFFTSSNKNMGYTDSGLKRLVLLIREISGVYFTIHQLRHTFATLMLEGGCDIYSLSKMMGHSDIKTTTIYLSASAEHLRSQVLKHPLNDMQI